MYLIWERPGKNKWKIKWVFKYNVVFIWCLSCILLGIFYYKRHPEEWRVWIELGAHSVRNDRHRFNSQWMRIWLSICAFWNSLVLQEESLFMPVQDFTPVWWCVRITCWACRCSGNPQVCLLSLLSVRRDWCDKPQDRRSLPPEICSLQLLL